MLAKGIDLGAPSKEIIYAKKLDVYIDKVKEILAGYSGKIALPVDFAYSASSRIEFDAKDLPTQYIISDIETKTISSYKNELARAKTVFVNGPCGIFETSESELGTKEIFGFIAGSKSYSVIGGGDSIAAVNKYKLTSGFSYICTGGGAMVRFLSGEELPVVKALKSSAAMFNKI